MCMKLCTCNVPRQLLFLLWSFLLFLFTLLVLYFLFSFFEYQVHLCFGLYLVSLVLGYSFPCWSWGFRKARRSDSPFLGVGYNIRVSIYLVFLIILIQSGEQEKKGNHEDVPASLFLLRFVVFLFSFLFCFLSFVFFSPFSTMDTWVSSHCTLIGGWKLCKEGNREILSSGSHQHKASSCARKDICFPWKSQNCYIGLDLIAAVQWLSPRTNYKILPESFVGPITDCTKHRTQNTTHKHNFLRRKDQGRFAGPISW